MATRCCWPPESSPGYLVAWSEEADAVEKGGGAAFGFGAVAAEDLLLGEAEVVGDAEVGEELEVLEDHADGGRGAWRGLCRGF